MSPPAIILIDGFAYRVTRAMPEGSESGHGQYDADKQRICVRLGLAPHYERSVVLHEVMHGLWEHAGLTAEGRAQPTEEEVVSALSYRLLEVLRSNPALVRYLTEGK
jgi:hypothetical protein